MVLNYQFSNWSYINAGVRQGSILEPLLFLAYIYDLLKDLTMTAKLFTNDTLLFSVIHDSGASSMSFNDDFLKISRWAYQWKMAFSTDASKQAQDIVFSHKPSPTNHGHIPDGMRCL